MKLYKDDDNDDDVIQTPLTYIDTDIHKWKHIENIKWSMYEIGGYRFRSQENVLHVSIRLDLIDINKLSLLSWTTKLPYIFNTTRSCSDGLKYFNKKLSEAKNILRKINNDSYLNIHRELIMSQRLKDWLVVI